MFPFRSKKPDLPPFMTPEFKQFLELHGLLVDIKLGQSLMQQRLDRMSEEIVNLQRNETSAVNLDNELGHAISASLYPGLEADEFEAAELRYVTQDFQELMNSPEVQIGMAQVRSDFEAFKARQSFTTRTSRCHEWRRDSSLKEARRLLQLQHPDYTSQATGIDPLELLKQDWISDSEANCPKSEGLIHD